MQRQQGAIEMLEQAVDLLRSAPAATVVIYLIGAIPFTVALMFFLVDMTHSPFAFEHLSQASLAMALLYVWKHAWKGVFCARLHGQLAPPPKSIGNAWRTISIQAGFQSLKLILPFFPLPWLSAFYRNLALFAGLGTPHPVRTAGRQAGLWPRQNLVILLMVSLAFLLLFINVLVLLIILPQLARTFLGIEGDMARLGARAFLSWTATFMAAALTWLAIDPLLDAVYVLRCFYGESVTSGEDLRAALRNATVAAALVVACFLLQPAVRAQDTSPQPTTSVDAARLDNSIQEVIHRREFTWRIPLPQSDKDDGRVVSWFRSFWQTIGKLWDWIGNLIDNWLRNRQTSEANGNGAAVTRRQLEVLIGIVVALITAAAIFFFRGKRRPVVAAQAVQGATPAIDLADESLTADQLPEDSWWKLAEELRAKGEHRLAMRALYLAGINHLAGRGLVSVRRWKTGLEYRRELDRRARATPALPPLFATGVALFEQGWYGHHPVDPPLVDALMASIRDLKFHAQPK